MKLGKVSLQNLISDDYISYIVGIHHGFVPNTSIRRDVDETFGGKSWLLERHNLVNYLSSSLNVQFPKVTSPIQVKLLSGLTTVSDWIASGSLFEDPQKEYKDIIDIAIDNAGFIKPIIKINLSFKTIFGFEQNLIQHQFTNIINNPGVYILEAPMGIGKTEAALYVAYKMLTTNKAVGIYFALPTQLTSNKIYERMQKFLNSILLPDSLHKKLILVHANSKLTEMGEDANPGGEWFNHSKRALLAPFAVGTIDQALMSVLNVKHSFIRSFGLFGKVVILDEVHTYDSYTGMLLEELINELKNLQCTVIILSATLTHDKRQTFLNTTVKNNAYPLISMVSNDKNILQEVALPFDKEKKVKIEILNNEIEVLNEVLYRASLGQQILWIENTVNDAQLIFAKLSARSDGLEIGLLHSQYLRQDRTEIEEYWTNIYGKNNYEQRGKKGRVLVGTQILEQSLDIDADFLVSKIAPVDMLLQRLGRLWRHDNDQRNQTAICEMWIIAPELSHAVLHPDKSFQASAKVYSPYVLCRSLEVILTKKQIILPNDIRDLIESTYNNRDESGLLLKMLNELKCYYSAATQKKSKIFIKL